MAARDAAAGEPAPEHLLSRIARGDQAALRALYDRFEGRVYRYARTRLNDPFAAADVVNDVMLEIWKNAASFAGRSAVSTWVLGIARHKILDQMRRERRHVAESLTVEPADEDSPSAADAIAGLQNAGRLAHCLERLSAAHREAVHLAFFEQLSYGEIGALVGTPEGTVKTRIFHAKQALKHCLGRID